MTLCFFVMDKGQTVWDDNNPCTQQIRSIRLDRAEFGIDLFHDASQHILSLKAKFDPWLESEDMITAANAIIILCRRVTKILKHQMNHRLEDFATDGGFTENMTQTRLEAKKQQNAEQGAPKCPICGETMMKRTIRKGEREGQQFWGCPNYYKTGCKGTLKID